MNKLYRSKKNRWLTGLCGGIAEHFDINPLAVRIAALLFEFSVFGLIGYFVLAFCVPEQQSCDEIEDNSETADESENQKDKESKDESTSSEQAL